MISHRFSRNETNYTFLTLCDLTAPTQRSALKIYQALPAKIPKPDAVLTLRFQPNKHLWLGVLKDNLRTFKQSFGVFCGG